MLGKMDTSQRTQLDSRKLGLYSSMISEASWLVLKSLQARGFKAYLVGGCVRDLLLNRKPKDYDIITTANLKQVKKQFYRSYPSQIVGRRFPICIVHLKNTVIEVSSFETAVEGTIEKEKFLAAQKPPTCQKSDLVLWRDSMSRDFTVNSLFFNPFEHKIYDYANGLGDIKSLKLRTLIPAHISFTEDSARILRAVRIAARLCLSFSKEIESAISDLSFSVLSISQSRIMMELNYMLSYGAAQPSISLLQRVGLLEILLPFHAAYLTKQGRKYGENSTMLMKLLYNLDRLSSCEQPSDSGVWVGLFVFHMALVDKPQHPLVVFSLASLLYYGNWKAAVHFARLQIEVPISFEPELLEATAFISDRELAERVIQLAILIQESVHILTNADSLHEMMENFPGSACSGLVFVPKNMRSFIAKVFGGIDGLIKRNTQGRTSFDINYDMLQKCDVKESRFVIGKIVMETICCVVDHEVMAQSEEDHVEKELVEKQLSCACESLPANNMTSNDDVFTRVKREMQQKKEEQQLATKKQKVDKTEDDRDVAKL
ncbi:uncharacterized protein LOC141712192 isoform X2 [Apium graveolens]|uniref:uncharacterized protein LOC141712192 isoform X2 n=1 Tax=Apium graveolens TaxID=4045 RepID=UPI003D7ADE55